MAIDPQVLNCCTSAIESAKDILSGLERQLDPSARYLETDEQIVAHFMIRLSQANTNAMSHLSNALQRMEYQRLVGEHETT